MWNPLSYLFIGLGAFMNLLTLLFLRDSYINYFKIIRMLQVEADLSIYNKELLNNNIINNI